MSSGVREIRPFSASIPQSAVVPMLGAALRRFSASIARSAVVSVLGAAFLWGAGPVGGTTAPNPMHPLFAVLDADGRTASVSGKPASADQTCGVCHDTDYINAHNVHATDRASATCVDCHFQGGAFPSDPAAYDSKGRLLREAMQISAPSNEACARCHGVVHTGSDPVRIPPDFEAADLTGDTRRTCALTRNTGEILSGQDISDSYLNVEGKADRTYPWDLHSRRLVTCIECHYAPNNPEHTDVKDSELPFLRKDPRRLPLAEYLHRPDHRLRNADCRSCHDPAKMHEFLPSREIHMQSLACQACHAPKVMGPAARSIDATVVTADGAPAVEYRGADRPEGASLNAAYIHGYTPLLLHKRDDDGRDRLAPYNAVDHWDWVSGETGAPVPIETVRRAYLDGSGYVPAVLATLDDNRDGRISGNERRLDTDEKTALIRSRLEGLGVRDPEIRRSVSFHPIRHGVLSGAMVRRDCARCHAAESQIATALPLSDFTLPGAGSTVALEEAPDAVVRGSEAGLEVAPSVPASKALYVFGHSQRGWSENLGLALFLLTVAGVLIHTAFRLLTANRRLRHPVPTRPIYMYTRYERIWHWLMAASILALMVTGIAMHYAGDRSPLPSLVRVHHAVAVIMIANAFLSLFYHLTTSAIRQFLPGRKGLLGKVARQARFYTRGLFLGQPHPTPKSPDRKLNPLQQVTYLVLLNVLFPVQVVTGALIWGAARWPELTQALGGLGTLGALHNLGSWLFIAFFALHVYLTTTGHTVFSNVRAMINGREQVELAYAGGTDA